MEATRDTLVDRDSLGQDSAALLVLCEKLATLIFCVLVMRPAYTGNLVRLTPAVRLRRFVKPAGDTLDLITRRVFATECDLAHESCSAGTPGQALHALAWLLYHQLRALDAPPFHLSAWGDALAAEMCLHAYPSLAEKTFDLAGDGLPWRTAYLAWVDRIAPHRDVAAGKAVP